MTTEQSVMAVIRAARPQFGSQHDKLAFAVHAAFAAAGYVLHATGSRAFRDDWLSISTTDEVGMDDWNSLPENYAFVYSKPDKGSKKVLVKALVMNGTLVVDVLKEDASEPQHLELNTAEYIENGGTSYNSHYKNLGKLVEKVDKEILDKLDGAPAAKLSNQPSSSSETRVSEDRDRPRMGFDDPDDRYSPYSGFVVPPIHGSGGSDLFPGPGAGMYPSRDNFGSGGPGGMLIGPNDPMFLGRGPRGPGMPGGLPGVPPGARFDPFGPPDVPGFEPDRFGRSRPTRGRGMHPDLERFHNGSDFI